MGVTCTLTYIGPYLLQIPMTYRVRLYISSMVQIITCLVETIETLRRHKKLEIGTMIKRQSFHDNFIAY